MADPDKFATIKLHVRASNPDMRYIIQLTNSAGKVQQELRDVVTGEYLFRFVEVGDVMVRIVEDANGNGEWDTGDMVAMRQPERTEIYKNGNGEELFTTKANWEFELDIDMDEVFRPVTMQSIMQMLEDRETARLKKLAEEQAKKRKEQEQSGNHGDDSQQSTGLGFGGMGGLGGNVRTGIQNMGR